MRLMLVWVIAKRLPNCHRRDRNDPERKHPVAVERRKLVKNDPSPSAANAAAHRNRHETGHRRRRAVVNIRHPEVKRHGAGFESETDQQVETAADQIKPATRSADRVRKWKSGSGCVDPVAP